MENKFTITSVEQIKKGDVVQIVSYTRNEETYFKVSEVVKSGEFITIKDAAHSVTARIGERFNVASNG